MSYLGTEKLKELIKTQNVIGPDPNFERVKSGAYELSLGNEVFRTDSPDKKKEIFTNSKEQITINPGQFALLLTEESLQIPDDKIAFISIKAGIKLRGLINVSGFHVDPGFKGNLVFSVYNAGTGPISLERGEPCFLIWFAELSLIKGETSEYNGKHKNQNSIPTKYIDALIAGELASPNTLSKRIDNNQEIINNRIALVEKEQTAKDYLVKTAVGLGIIILVKIFFDWLAYDNGFKKGMEFKQKEQLSDSIVHQMLLQKKKLLIEIDSLEKRNRNMKNLKTG